MKNTLFIWSLLFLISASQPVLAQVQDEIAVEGIIIPADLIDIDSNYVQYLGIDNANQKINIRRIDFLVVQDSMKANLLKRDNLLFAPYVRVKNAPTADEGHYTSFRDMYMSKKSVMYSSFAYKATDFHYLAGQHLQKASRSIIIGTAVALVGGAVSLLVDDNKLKYTGLAVGAIGFSLGITFTGSHLNQAGFYLKKSAEKSW